jgi:hypothetical protein
MHKDSSHGNLSPNPGVRKAEAWFSAPTCWLTPVKELGGLAVRRAPYRQGLRRRKLCPPDKQAPIREALGHFEMLS